MKQNAVGAPKYKPLKTNEDVMVFGGGRMNLSRLALAGEVVDYYAQFMPTKIAARDSVRSLTYRQWSERSCRLANGLLGIGLIKGDRVAILAYNCLEWLEIYVAIAKAGLIAVPINFRLVGPEIEYIVTNCGASAMIVQEDLRDQVEGIRSALTIPENHYLLFGSRSPRAGYRSYEEIMVMSGTGDPPVEVLPEDPWTIMYTSGTTGKPKGAVRNHGHSAQLAIITALDQGFAQNDIGLIVMPLCHANSLWYVTLLAYCGATTAVFDQRHFNPESLLRALHQEQATFTSLVPTHYIMLLGLSQAVKIRYQGDTITKLLISSAPARRDTKLAIMDFFKNAKLYEGYGSTEAGWVTLLRPDEQLEKLGSIGRETTGSKRIKLLDDSGNDVADGEVGEIYSHTPYAFQEYWNLPEKTSASFRGSYCSVGDMARRDEGGYYFLADRKSNMIISGGENIYPSEVENLLGAHDKVKDVAVIGVPDEKWGETVMAVIVLHDGAISTETEILGWCHDRIGGYKRPHYVRFIKDNEMPRTATGKIQHRILREKYKNDFLKIIAVS
jgi:fatty-acyl-CoA synthase